MKKFLFISFIVITAAIIGVIIYQSNSTVNTGVTSLNHPTATVKENDFVMTSYGTGYLEGIASETLFFPITGVIEEITVNPGDSVQINDLVATLIDDEKQILLNKALINLEKLTSPSMVTNTEINILLAQEQLDEAELNLETVIAGPPIDYYLDQLEIATNNYYSTLDKIRSLKNPPTRLYQALENAKIALEQAQTDLDNALAYVVPEADINRAQAEVNLAVANLEGENTLLSYITGSSDNAFTGLSISEELIDVKNAEWQVFNAQQELNNTLLQTPVDGYVMGINVVAGESISGNTPIMTISNPEKTELRIYLDESEFSGLSIGDAVLVNFLAYPDTTYSAHITGIDFSIVTVNGENKVQAWAIFDEPLNVNLPLGAEANVEVITVEEDNVLTIPYQALIRNASGQYQVIVLSNGQSEYRTITIGMSDFTDVIIKTGLEAGEVVSTNPGSFGEEEK